MLYSMLGGAADGVRSAALEVPDAPQRRKSEDDPSLSGAVCSVLI